MIINPYNFFKKSFIARALDPYVHFLLTAVRINLK